MKTLSRRIAPILLLLSIASMCRAGVVYSAQMEKFGKTSTFEVWATDTKAKFSVARSDDPSMPAGMTIIALDSGARYVLMIPSKGGYIELTKEQFDNLRGKRAQDSGAEFRDGKLEELIVDEEGGTVAGVQTRHYKIRISVTGAERGQKLDIVAIEEFWTAPTIPNPARSLDMLTEQKSGIGALDSLMEYKKLRGYPLKRTVQLFMNGEFAGSSLVEVKTILDQPVPDSVFEIPTNYKRVETPAHP